MKVFIAVNNSEASRNVVDIAEIKSGFERDAYFIVDGGYEILTQSDSLHSENFGNLGAQEILTFIVENAEIIIAIIGAFVPLLNVFKEPVLEVTIEADGKKYNFVGTQMQVESFIKTLGLEKATVVSSVTMVGFDASA